MKKIINQPQDVVSEMLDGLTYAYGDLIEKVPDFEIIQRKSPKSGKVALVSGGGSGHEPAHAGFVGEGMLSAAVCGAIFTSPTPDQIYEAIKSADEGAGVLLIIENYSGDVMNFEMAREMAEMEDIKVEQIIVDDDIAVENSLYTQGRRGVAGTVLVHKILGAAAHQGASLDEIKDLADFVLDDNEIEYGVGIHSEPGYRREKMKTSYELATELVGKLKEEFKFEAGQKYGILVNGMGATPLMEQFIFMNDVVKLLTEENIEILFKKVGNYMTSIDMAGLSLTMIKLEDDPWLKNLNEDVKTISWG